MFPRIPTVVTPSRIGVLDLVSPVLDQDVFLHVVNERIQDLNTVASTTTWTRKIGTGQHKRATSVMLVTSTSQVVADNTVVVIPCEYRDHTNQACASRCVAFACAHIVRSRKQRLTVHICNVPSRGLRRGLDIQDQIINTVRPCIEYYIPNRLHEKIKFKFRTFLSNGEKS